MYYIAYQSKNLSGQEMTVYLQMHGMTATDNVFRGTFFMALQDAEKELKYLRERNDGKDWKLYGLSIPDKDPFIQLAN